MALVINEEQMMLKESAREFLKEKAPVEALRRLRDTKDPKGYDASLWKEMADMGWTAMTIPEKYGGLGFGFVGFGQVLEETGRTLTASPLVSTVLLGSTAIQMAGNQAQKEKFLPAIAEGNCLLTIALEEKGQHNPLKTSCKANQKDDYFVINGRKQFVLDGHIADHLIVVARSSEPSPNSEGISMLIVDSSLPGVKIERTVMMDSRNAAIVHFDNVKVPKEELLGEQGKVWPILEYILDIARIGLASEMLGTMQEAFDRTLAYIKDRQQFGVSIAVFQALQHRAAQMYCEIELCKSVVLKALQAIDGKEKNLAELASLTKAKTGETLQLVTNEAIQMFGGIGMTDDEEIGFFLKRARVAQNTLGDYNYHLDRYAKLKGF